MISTLKHWIKMYDNYSDNTVLIIGILFCIFFVEFESYITNLIK